MELTTVWFGLIAALWIGYFVLEGFDFGVGMLVPVLGRTDRERRVVINTIGPVWDGNEVWLLVAAGATFAAFPEWYATLFSGFYLPLLLILVSLIIRNVGFDYRGKRTEPAWRRRWDTGIVLGSVLPAFGWGLVFGTMLHGVPLDADHEFVGGVADLLNPFAVLTGLVTLTVFLTHGAIFLALKSDGDIRHRANALAVRVGLLAAALLVVWLVWLGLAYGNPVTVVSSAAAVAGLAGALLANRLGREGWAFVGTAATILLAFLTVFVALFPAVLPSTTDPAWSLTVVNAASTPYTLTIMTWAAAFLTPLVIAYQGWTYWVFRRRVTLTQIADDVADEPVRAGRR
jgi:cytochrome bd ubiquinol oxidase subunit II